MKSSSATNKEKEILIGPPKLTRFERARIVGARALQIAMGAPVLLEIPDGMADPIDIALLEFDKKAIPLTVIRERKERISFPRVV